MKTPKSILITGASSGIGRALAIAYAAEGVTLFLNGRDPKRLAQVEALCRQKKAAVVTAALDVTDKAPLAEWIAQCDDTQPLDLVIANAGISSSSVGESEGMNALKMQQKIIDVNLQGTFNTIFPILPRMQHRQSGHIALMSSMSAFRGLPRSPAYACSKAALKIYGEGMGAKWSQSGIVFSVICPGFVQTPLTDKNKFGMPFKITVDKAVRHIIRGLNKRQPLIAFPFSMHIVCYILSLLPTRLAKMIMNYLAG
jgi:short-subunit dehydrogenase